MVLSEYWEQGVEEGEYDRPIKDLLEADAPQARAVQEALAAALGTDFRLETVSGGW